MFDHIGVKVADLEASVAFYEQALGALGHRLGARGEGYAGFGPPGAPELWLYEDPAGAGPGTHLALRAADRAAVELFYAQGLAAGGRDNGPPGLRTHYSADYFAAFLIDPDGHNVEAVCFSAG
jgi:catechol 2,3-dioxygenase-like lactoylglutathione lyase family enzyme